MQRRKNISLVVNERYRIRSSFMYFFPSSSWISTRESAITFLPRFLLLLCELCIQLCWMRIRKNFMKRWRVLMVGFILLGTNCCLTIFSMITFCWRWSKMIKNNIKKKTTKYYSLVLHLKIPSTHTIKIKLVMVTITPALKIWISVRPDTLWVLICSFW